MEHGRCNAHHFPMLHPELQFAEDKDPAVLAEEAARNWSLFNPAAEHARLLNDPAYREHFAAMEILIQTGVPQEIGN